VTAITSAFTQQQAGHVQCTACVQRYLPAVFTPLTSPVQRVKLRSQPAQWVAKAAELQRAREEARREVAEARLRVAGAVRTAQLASHTLASAFSSSRSLFNRACYIFQS
jgi:hypothetical protein